MTAKPGAAQREVPSGAEDESQRVLARPRATSVPASLAPAPDPAPDVTESDPQKDVRRRAAGLRKTAAQLSARPAAVLSGASLLHSAPPSLADARDHHHAAAGHFNGWLLRDLRLAWGYLHLVIKAVLHTVEWVTASLPRLLVTLFFIAVIWLWH